MINNIFLIALCVSIIIESVQRIIYIEKVENPKMMLIIGSVGLTLNMVT